MVHVWYKNKSGVVQSFVRKETLLDADMFLMSELSGRAYMSEYSRNDKEERVVISYFGVGKEKGEKELIGVAVTIP